MMMMMNSDLVLSIFLIKFVMCTSSSKISVDDIHGGVVMGIKNTSCDDGKTMIATDWNWRNQYEYTCLREERFPTNQKHSSVACIPNDRIPKPRHECMSKKIVYLDRPPRGGPHRPLWPKYGDYLYLPEQRWVHSLEHGAAVFLYHPCSEVEDIMLFQEIARKCLWKHIITPYKYLDSSFAVITYGCKYTSPKVVTSEIIDYIEKYALKAPEATYKDGQYDFALIRAAGDEAPKGDNTCPGQMPQKPSDLSDLSERISQYFYEHYVSSITDRHG